MARLKLFQFLIAISLLCAIGIGFPYQLVMNAQGNTVNRFSSEIITGSDANSLLRDLANRMRLGYSQNWESVLNMPLTRGTSSTRNIISKDLDQLVNEWGLHPSIREEVYRDVRLLVDLHAQEAIYTSQKFSYSVPGCGGGGELPVCMHSVFVLVRRILTIAADESGDSDVIEIRHIYVDTFSNAIQQYRKEESCHFCWFRTCCHDNWVPREFYDDELFAIHAALSTKSSEWANENIPSAFRITTLAQDLSLSGQLRQFVGSKFENKDVFKEHDDTLLNILQGAMQTAHQRTRSFSLSLKEQNLPHVGNLILPCLKEAGIEQTLQELWQQAQEDLPGLPFSLECQNIKWTQSIEERPSKSCNSSSTVKIDTKYSWILLSPHTQSIECIFIGSDVTAAHTEYVKKSNNPDDSNSMQWSRRPYYWPKLAKKLSEQSSEGSIIRLSVPEQDGSFSSVEYLSQWTRHTEKFNKAIMDIIRYASANAYLKTPITHSNSPSNLDIIAFLPFEVNTSIIGESLEAIGKGLSSIAEGWSKLSDAIGPRSSETVRRQICLGFKRYEHAVKALTASGIPQARLGEAVDTLIKIAGPKNQDVNDLRKYMTLIEFSNDLSWSGQTVSYTSNDGFHRFFHFYKYFNQTTNAVDIAFGTLATDFTIAPDTLIIEKKSAGWFGLRKEETTEYRDVPHTITPNDTILLNTFFEVVLYRQMASVLRLPAPEYPPLGRACITS